MIIGISGKRGCGKDTLAGFMAEHQWKQKSFAAELKKRVRDDFELTTVHTDGAMKELPTSYKRQLDDGYYTPRDIMIRCGFYYRSIDPLYWVKLVYKDAKDADKIVISDVRFKNEANFIKERGGVLVRLERDKHLNIYKGDINDPSEIELDDYGQFDHVLPAHLNKELNDLKDFAGFLEVTYGSR
jgi:hypothetical protein